MAKKMENPHKFLSPLWYEWTHYCVKRIHDDFVLWTHDKGISSILEVGCGKHWFYHRVFANKYYIGLDVLPEAIEHCQHTALNYLHSWEVGDIHTSEPWETDLVFSHAVIDHSHDPDLFIRKSIESANKYVYIMSYRGWFPNIENHEIEKSKADGYYYADISIKQVRKLLENLDFDYELKKVPTGLPAGEIQNELHIIVKK